MAITVPTPQTMVDAIVFGKPVADEVNRLTILTAPTAWVNITFAAGWGANGFARYRKVGDVVEFIGELLSTSALAANSTVTTMPVGFRPAFNAAVLAPYFDGTANNTWLQMSTAGVLAVNKAIGGASQSVQIVGLRYATTS